MSYILDALRRSEQERQQSQQTTVLSHPPKDAESRTSVPWLAGLLVTNLLLVAGFFWWMRQTPSAPPDPIDPASTTATSDISTSVNNPTTASRPVPVRFEPPSPASTSAPARSTPTIPPPANIQTYSQAAPPPGLTNLSVSTHIYSSDADFRAVIVNGERLSEGEAHSLGFRVQEITETGVVIERDGQVFELDVAN